jgi:hypothetical protein
LLAVLIWRIGETYSTSKTIARCHTFTRGWISGGKGRFEAARERQAKRRTTRWKGVRVLSLVSVLLASTAYSPFGAVKGSSIVIAGMISGAMA